MQFNAFSDYVANYLRSDYQLKIDTQISAALIEFDWIRKPGKLPRLSNIEHQKIWDSINFDFDPSIFNFEVEDIKTKLLHNLVDSPKSIENIMCDAELIDKSSYEIDSLVGKLAEQSMDDGIDFDAKIIKKRLFNRQRFLQESIALHAQIIGKGKMTRCTGWALNNRKDKLKKQDEWAKKNIISNGVDSFTLADAGNTRSKRLNELYVIAKGIEKLGDINGKAWASVVCTVPANMHPNPSIGKKTWDGTLPNESAKWLQENWALVRARLAKEQITLSGIWTREAHADGTPHINFLIYFDEWESEKVKKVFFEYFAHSSKAVKWQDGLRGEKQASFASYAFKYFAKLFGDGDTQSDDSICEEAWASAFSLRRYGFFGIPPVEQWRRLRAQRTAPNSTPLLDSLWRAARRNDSAAWISLSGGLGLKNSHRPIKTITDLSETGKSRIAVGVEEIATGAQIISKKIGEWTLFTLTNSIIQTKKTTETQSVTLSLSYPSEKLNVIAESTLNSFMPIFRGEPYPRK